MSESEAAEKFPRKNKISSIRAEILTGGYYRKTAFTLAEVLITLAIIGVVSALVIPSVLKNYNDKKYNTARLKALKTFGEAGKMASINGEINGQPTARAFVENVLSKYLKITKVCDKAEECGFPSQIQPSNPSSSKLVSDNLKTWKSLNKDIATKDNWTDINNENLSIYINTTDGFGAKIFYNPKCMRNSHENTIQENCTFKECGTYAIDQTCLNIIYDMNGINAPNHAGEDIGFITTFWSGLNATSASPGLITYNIAKAVFDSGWYKQAAAQKACADKGTSKVSYTLPSADEMKSLAINWKLSSLYGHAAYYTTGTLISDRPGFDWLIKVGAGECVHDNQNSARGVWCVRR